MRADGDSGLEATAAAAAAWSSAWAIDYAPMRALLDGGMVDVGYATSMAAVADAASGGETRTGTGTARGSAT